MLSNATLPSPVGPLRISVDRSSRLHQLELLRADQAGPGSDQSPDPVICPVADALDRYFAGDVEALHGVDVMFDRGTDFQRAVWHALRTIPAGSTITYGELARRVGRPRAVRAVGSANGANPVPIVVPCHRVVAASGLGGYALGLDVKRWLLAHEGALASPLLS